MNLSDFTLFIFGFGGSVAIASIVIYLAGSAGGPRRGERPGTDFYSSPPTENPTSFTAPNLTDVTPYTHPRAGAGTVDPRH
jgi:hypothetical protein